MTNLLDRLWRWWGKRRGHFDTESGCLMLTPDANGSPQRLVFRGIIPPGTATIYVDLNRSQLLAYNRLLTDAEVDRLNRMPETYTYN